MGFRDAFSFSAVLAPRVPALPKTGSVGDWEVTAESQVSYRLLPLAVMTFLCPDPSSPPLFVACHRVQGARPPPLLSRVLGLCWVELPPEVAHWPHTGYRCVHYPSCGLAGFPGCFQRSVTFEVLCCMFHRKPWALTDTPRRNSAWTPQETAVGTACPWVRKLCSLDKIWLGLGTLSSQGAFPHSLRLVALRSLWNFRPGKKTCCLWPGQGKGVGSGFLGRQAGCQEPACSGLIILIFSVLTPILGLCPACRPRRNPVFSASNRVHLSYQSQVN